MNWLDWVIIILLGYSTFQGLRYGLFLSMARLAGILAGLFAAYHYYQPFSLYLVEIWKIDEKIFPAVKEIFKSWVPVQSPSPPLTGKVVASISSFLPQGFLGSSGLPGQIIPNGDALLRSLSNTIIEAASFFVLFLAVTWVINIAGLLLTKLCDFSFLGPMNHLGGLIFGLLRGVAYVFILLLLLSPFQRTGTSSVPGAPPAACGKVFGESKLYQYFEPLIKNSGPGFSLPPLKGKDTTI